MQSFSSAGGAAGCSVEIACCSGGSASKRVCLRNCCWSNLRLQWCLLLLTRRQLMQIHTGLGGMPYGTYSFPCMPRKMGNLWRARASDGASRRKQEAHGCLESCAPLNLDRGLELVLPRSPGLGARRRKVRGVCGGLCNSHARVSFLRDPD